MLIHIDGTGSISFYSWRKSCVLPLFSNLSAQLYILNPNHIFLMKFDRNNNVTTFFRRQNESTPSQRVNLYSHTGENDVHMSTKFFNLCFLSSATIQQQFACKHVLIWFYMHIFMEFRRVLTFLNDLFTRPNVFAQCQNDCCAAKLDGNSRCSSKLYFQRSKLSKRI